MTEAMEKLKAALSATAPNRWEHVTVLRGGILIDVIVTTENEPVAKGLDADDAAFIAMTKNAMGPLLACAEALEKIAASCPHIKPHASEAEYDFGSQYFNTPDDYARYCADKNLSDVGDQARAALTQLTEALEKANV